MVEKYLWQGLTRLLAVYDGGNILRQRFEYADERMPVAMKMGAATYYLSYDQVGSLRLVADGSGNVVKRISYDSFGNILEDTNPSFTIPFGFAGGLHDRDTGLVRFGYRDYDPEVGRWTAKDPIGFEGGDTDLYGYILNNPINFVDENGLFIQSILKIFDKDKKVQDASNRINQLILEKGQIINKCINSGCLPTDYDKLNEIESQLSDTRKEAISDVQEAANEVSKSYFDLIFRTIKKVIPCK